MIKLGVFFGGDEVSDALAKGARQFTDPPADWPDDARIEAMLSLAVSLLTHHIKQWVWNNTSGAEREMFSWRFDPARDMPTYKALEVHFQRDDDAVAFKLRWSDYARIEEV